MTRLIYDGTFEGLLTAIFEIYERKLLRVNLQKEGAYGSAMFEDVLTIATDNNRANRVLAGLNKKVSANTLQRLYIAHLAEIENEDNTIVNFIRYAFDNQQNIEDDYGNRNVLRVSEIVTMMRRERHRMEAFIRFQKLSDGTFYAAIEPDFNVIPLLIKHFKNRYADQKWIIYDIKRHYGLYYDLHDTEYINLEFSEVNNPANVIKAYIDDEEIYQHLWKNYFTSVNIKSRKNTRLHVRHIPKRYWKHLTEKI
jgi:probable DNA metabolism protein